MSTNNQNPGTGNCCKGISYLTPASEENIPGLPTLIYRVGTHGKFKSSMLTGIASKPVLDDLKTREDDDASIALLDGWATVLDILTFYQERIINEGFLRTATERRSVLELARHISYKLNPGVAASTFMAFTIDEAIGAPTEATIPNGTKIQSIPGQDELPQVFETNEEILAKKEYNAIRPRLTQPQIISTSMDSVVVVGTNLSIKKGDVMILQGAPKKQKDQKKARKVIDLKIDQVNKTTQIVFGTPKLSPDTYKRRDDLSEGKVDDLAPYKKLNDAAIDIILSKTWKEEVLASMFRIKNWSTDDLVDGIKEKSTNQSIDSTDEVHVFRQTASVFGFNAQKQITCNLKSKEINPPAKWTEWKITNEKDGILYLENANEKILPNSYIVVKGQDTNIDKADIYKVTEVNMGSRTEYGISSKTTKLSLLPEYKWDPDKDDLSVIRDLIVYTQSEKLDLAEVGIDEIIEGNTLVLNGPFPELYKGQKMMLTGELSELNGISASEMRIIDEVILEAGFSVVTFKDALDNSYIRNTVTINANVAGATHGETRKELLGSGDGSKTFKEFVLKQKPLTYISASTTDGRVTTLQIRVNDIVWKEVPTLYGTSPDDKVYVTRIDNEGNVTVQFGDGITGSRLPTGVQNVKATYRVGTGLDGLLGEGQLSQMITPQLGVKGVSNPLAPTGGDDPEKIENARQNAPQTVLTLDRIVSLRDYEDFTLNFAGIGKARADLMWDGEQRVVYVTIASADGDVVDESSDLFVNLTEAIDKARYTSHKVIVSSFEPLFFDVKAKILINPDYLVEKVIDAAKDILAEEFSCEKRSFGQTVTPSEVMSVLQGVDGVIAVDLDELNGLDPFASEHFRLPSKFARWENGEVLPAQLLTINPEGIELNEMTK